MSLLHGFELLREETITETNTRARIFRHARTGAELISLENDDENKVFGITFATPPSDSTGLPHILEHSVLCGSRKYPVKDPFVQLLKGSLNTFVNAMTFSDKTVYPCASQNLQDFYNLVDVYLDAVFYPHITPQILEQEGWHYELEDINAPLIYKGVVFNEMKGAFSSPEGVLGRYTEQSLFPDNAYGHESGGDPRNIPDLTYEQFKSFHETYYHPSNARIWFYGDDDPEERLRLIDDFIKEFDKIELDASVDLQPRFEAPRTLTQGYAASEDEDNTAYVTVNWLLVESTDIQEAMGLQVLEHILLATPASPLRKALIESGLGEDVTGGGIDNQVREFYFSTGLKGINPADSDKVEALILDTLRELVANGIDKDTIEASLNTIEFSLREYNTGGFPRGLAMLITSLSTWLYGNDPLAPLRFEEPLQHLKETLASGERYFEGLIQRYFLENPHRTTVLLEPDPRLQSRLETEERARLQAVRDSLSEEDLLAIVENTQKLKEMQETPDSPEALATIPTLKLEDLDRENKTIPSEEQQVSNVPVLYHDLFTNGIVYLDLGFNLHALPERLLPYINIFGQALLEIGTETQDFVQLSQRIGQNTGGIHNTTLINTVLNTDKTSAWLVLRGKSTTDKAEDLLNILSDILLTVKLDNPERLLQIVLEEKAGKESGLVPAGHVVVNNRLKSHFSEAGWLKEQTDGIEYLFFLRELAETIKSDWAKVLSDLEEIRNLLITQQGAIGNVTLDADNWATLKPQLGEFFARLPQSETTEQPWQWQAPSRYEGFTIPAQVNYVGKGANLYANSFERKGAVSVVINFLGTNYLWEKVRVQGGAYGGFCGFDPYSGVFGFGSYRDPNLLETLDIYDNASAYLSNVEIDEDEVVKSIIGTIGSIDGYQLPDAKGYSAFVWHLLGSTESYRQKMREEILATTAADFKAFGETLKIVSEQGDIVVLGSPEAISAANEQRDNFLTVKKVK
jgi:Zn-dependent M16 (insulinase) family peptidase